MSSSEGLPGAGANPLAPIHQALEWALSFALQAGLALPLGLLAAWVMRARNGHWSWAAACMPAALLLGGALGGRLKLTLALACLTAAYLGRRWHRGDLEGGLDLAEWAARRIRPLDLLIALAGGATRRLRRAVGAEQWARPGALLLGADERKHPVWVPFAAGRGGAHTLVVGATGSGKTVTQTWMVVRAIEQGMGAVVIDPKGDRAMLEEARRAAEARGRRFLRWSPCGGSVYNPYATGGDTEIADKVLAGERFTEPHYLRLSQRYMGHVVRALRSSGIEVSLRRIVEHLQPAELEALVRELPEREAGQTHAYLDSLTPRQQSDLAGVRDRLATLAESDVGRWLEPGEGIGETFDVLGAVRSRAVVYFDLDADKRPLLGQMLAAAIVQDIQSAVSTLQRAPVPTVVAIDEFSAVAAEQVVRLFGRARSAGISMLLGTQELSDLRLPGQERLLERVMGNVSLLIAHRQVVPSSAQLVTELAGRRGGWSVSQHSDGRSTRSRQSRPPLDPGRVMGLAPGWAAVIVPGCGHARVTHVLSPARTR